jgi:hypothetical protein
MQHVWGRRKGHITFWWAEPEGKRLLGNTRRRWEHAINIDLQEVVWNTNWINLAQNRNRWRALVNAVMSLRVRGRFLTS